MADVFVALNQTVRMGGELYVRFDDWWRQK
jgi:hypothetical protein